MTSHTWLPATLAALFLATSATGCIVVADDGPVGYGTLAVTWTLDGYDDPYICSDYDVDRFDLVVYDADGFLADEDLVPCDYFGVAFDLPAGFYTAEMALTDNAGYAVSSTLVVDVDVVRNREVVIDVDFPDASIF